MRVFLSFLVIVGFLVFSYTYGQSEGVIEGQLAVEQLKDDDAAYVAGRAGSQGLIRFLAFIGTLTTLAVIWFKQIRRGLKDMRGSLVIKTFILGALVGLTGCMKPYMEEKFVDIEPNQTAFVVPLEGASKSNQGKFESVEFLEEKKVAAKRITIPRRYRSTGRMWFDAEIIDTVRVITVDRSPVSRRWTDVDLSVITPSDECIWVESQDSIGFGLGVTITAAVLEDDTAKFLYMFPSGKSLSQIVDQEIKAYVQQILARDFGKLDLKDCKVKKAEIFATARSESTTFFKETYGITITTLGHSGGLTYENKEIQDAINENYVAEMSIEKRENEALAQEHENARLLSIEQNNRARAEEFNLALEAQREKIMLDIEHMRAEAQLEMARKWNGQLPSQILPSNSPLLMNLGAGDKK